MRTYKQAAREYWNYQLRPIWEAQRKAQAENAAQALERQQKQQPSPVLVGVDVGQVNDPAAIVAAVMEERRDVDGKVHSHYAVKHMARLPLGTSYIGIVERCHAIEDKLSKTYQKRKFLVDCTGSGRVIVDLYRERNMAIRPVTITFSGRSHVKDGWLHLTKGEMAANLSALFDTKRVHLPARSRYANVIRDELRTYKIKVSQAGNAQFGAFSYGEHDDLITALGFVCYYGERAPRGRVRWI